MCRKSQIMFLKQLKDALISTHILTLLSFTYQLTLHTNASNVYENVSNYNKA